ncbi:MAG TPA: hypothetical protein VF789_05095 [Thermoanaerobaculia bacterium]
MTRQTFLVLLALLAVPALAADFPRGQLVEKEEAFAGLREEAGYKELVKGLQGGGG